MAWKFYLLFKLLCLIWSCFGRDIVVVSPSPNPPSSSEQCRAFCYNTNNISISCNVIDCSLAINSSGPFASAPSFSKDQVSYYIFNDTSTNEKHLALKTQWEVKYDATLPHVTAYRARLLMDGELQDEVCLNMSRKLGIGDEFSYFSYDCFGRKDRNLEPKKKYMLEVATLPLNPNSRSVSRVDYTMPDCVDGKVHEVAECGLTPVSQELSTDCSTVYKGHHVDCKVLAIDLSDSLEVLKYELPLGNQGPPSSPTQVGSEDKENWYTFFDESSNSVKVALNVSWSPSDDSSISQLRGYNIQVLAFSTIMPSVFTIYNISTPLTFEKHVKIDFHYDFFGRGLFLVEPGHEYKVFVTSMPKPNYKQDPLAIHVTIPGCVDKRMEHVSYCKDKIAPPIKITIDEVFCFNRSIQLSYNAPAAYGKDITRIFCQYSGDSLHKKCETLADKKMSKNIATVYDITLSPSKPLNGTYFVWMISTNQHLNTYTSDFFNFTRCVEELKPVSSTPTYSIAIVICVAITVACLVIIVYILLQKRRQKYHDNHHPMQSIIYPVKPPKDSKGTGSEQQAPPITIKQSTIEGGEKVCVFVVYTNDCEKHRMVVHQLCSFLRQDLQLDVNTYLWDSIAADQNPIPWMEFNLARANKVLVICSEGSKYALKHKMEKDRFSPVIKQIIDHNFIRKNVGKYLYAYFDYSTENHIPDQLRDSSALYCSQFKLMKQFEELYFRLIGKEQYQEGKIMRIDKIGFDCYDTSPENKCGRALKDSIDEMAKYVEQNPTWFSDLHGDAMPVSTLPTSVLASSYSYKTSEPSYQPIENEGAEMSSIQMLSITAPDQNTKPQPQVEIKQSMKSVEPHPKAMPASRPPTRSNNQFLEEIEEEDLCIHPKKKQTMCIGKGPESTIPLLSQVQMERTPVENFCHQKEPLRNESQHLNDPLSHMADDVEPETMETIVPIFSLDDEPHDVRGSDFTPSLFSDNFVVDFEGGSFQNKVAATRLNLDSGVFTLAQIDDDIDIDDEFQSINQSSMGQFRDI